MYYILMRNFNYKFCKGLIIQLLCGPEYEFAVTELQF